jgi:hypothetical protein
VEIGAYLRLAPRAAPGIRATGAKSSEGGSAIVLYLADQCPPLPLGAHTGNPHHGERAEEVAPGERYDANTGCTVPHTHGRLLYALTHTNPIHKPACAVMAL